MYAFEMSEAEHRELAAVLHGIEGRAVLSGYHSALYDELYEDWFRVDAPTMTAHSTKQQRSEVVWMNFEPFVGDPRVSS